MEEEEEEEEGPTEDGGKESVAIDPDGAATEVKL